MNTRTTTTQLQKKLGQAVKDIAIKELSNKRLFVVDAFCGANKDTRMAIRFIVEVAWQAHFVTNMFIQANSRKNLRTSSQISLFTMLLRLKLRTTKS